jgi:Flp pilus assembly protein TadB
MTIAVLAAVVVVVAAAMAMAVSKLQLNHQEEKQQQGRKTKQQELGTPLQRVATQTKGASRGAWMETPCGRLLRRAALIGKRESIEAKTLIEFLSI